MSTPMETSGSDWDSYTPKFEGEFDLCVMCVKEFEHSVADHKLHVALGQMIRRDRQDALDRQARRQYDSNR